MRGKCLAASLLGVPTLLLMLEVSPIESLHTLRAFNTALPAFGLLLSASIIAVQYALSARKHKRSAIAVAQLDPGASNIVETFPDASVRDSRPNILVRILTSLLPWNAPRLLGYHSVDSTEPAGKSKDDVVSSATLAVFQTENAMILNEVHSIPLTFGSEEEIRARKLLNVSQRFIHTVAAVALAAFHAAGFAMGGGMGEAVWAVFWVSFA